MTKEEQWRQLPWAKFDHQIRKIQRRIYDASLNGDKKCVKDLQKRLVGLTGAKFLAVKRVSQDKGKKRTAGMDGKAWLNHTERMELVHGLKIDAKADAVRRVWLAAPDGRQTSYGIPTMKDRAKQTLVRMALEPEWEARFEPNSYGFRPGRNCQHARAAICQTLKQKAKYIFLAKVEPCFPSLAHEPLLNKLNTFPRFRKQIRAWLKAGLSFEAFLTQVTSTPPQAGPLSPLLVNIALHGLEKHVNVTLANGSSQCHLPLVPGDVLTVRYANDFAILCGHDEDLKRLKTSVEQWLSGLGLTLCKPKTKLNHSLNFYGELKPGFLFLGFYFQHKKCGIGKTAWVANRNSTKPLGYVLKQVPSKHQVQKHISQMRNIVKAMESRSQEELIATLNPKIRAWTQYYAFTDNAKTFRFCDQCMFWRLMRYACNRHRRKGKKWIVNKYFHTYENRKWVFATPEGRLRLMLYGKSGGRNRLVKVDPGKSPYDGPGQCQLGAKQVF